jgi:hypothetical protein
MASMTLLLVRSSRACGYMSDTKASCAVVREDRQRAPRRQVGEALRFAAAARSSE